MWVTILLASKFTSPIVKATRWPSGETRGSPTRRTFSRSLMVNWRLSCANATEASATMKIKVDTTKRFIGILLELVSAISWESAAIITPNDFPRTREDQDPQITPIPQIGLNFRGAMKGSNDRSEAW